MAIVNVGIIGSGVVGQALARGFARLGQGVKIGSRTPEKLSDFIEQNDGVTSGTFEETARFGDLIALGGIEAARYLEPMCMVWVLHGALSGTWTHAFKMLHK